MAFLEVKNVHTYYGHIHALKDLSLTVEKGEVVTLIGGNGAGKSTTLNTMSGLLKPRQGSIQFEGEELTRYRAHEIVAKGVVQVPEGRRVFGRLTVTENLEMGAFTCRDKKLMESNIDRVFASLSQAGRKAQTVGRDPERRGTANARHGQGLDGQSKTPSP